MTLFSLILLFSVAYFIFYLFFFSYVGRPVAASTATGSKVQHLKELSQLLEDATRID